MQVLADKLTLFHSNEQGRLQQCFVSLYRFRQSIGAEESNLSKTWLQKVLRFELP